MFFTQIYYIMLQLSCHDGEFVFLIFSVIIRGKIVLTHCLLSNDSDQSNDLTDVPIFFPPSQKKLHYYRAISINFTFRYNLYELETTRINWTHSNLNRLNFDSI